MAASEVSICNLALQLLGQSRITSLSEDSANARECNASYEAMRDAEIEAHPWSFAVRRATLAPDTATPEFDFDYAFSWPTDCLRPLPPRRDGLDWEMEDRKILTNDGAVIYLRYLAAVTDPARFSPLFVNALAARIALHLCERITQSNQKKIDAEKAYAQAISAARRSNAFAKISDEPPEDPWMAARY